MTDTYKTSDLALAAFLLASKETLVTTEREGRKLIFCFAPSPEIDILANSFINGGTVEARAYFHAIRDLKNLVKEN